MKKTILRCCAVWLAGVAVLAATPAMADTATVSWTNPTTWESPPVPAVPLVLDHNKVYRGTKADGSDFVLVATLKPPAGMWIDTAPKVGQNCYAVTASSTAAGQQESGRSPIACKTIAAPPPPPPPPRLKPPATTTVK